MTQHPRSPSRKSANEVPQNISLSPAALPPELGDVRTELPLASPIIHNAIRFTVGFGAAADGSEAIVLQASLPPLTVGGHNYLEQLAAWCALRLSPAITRGRVAIVDRDEAERILTGATIAGGAEVLGGPLAAGWADKYVRFLVESADAIVEAANGIQLGDVGNDYPDAEALRSSINAAAVARPIDELERRLTLDPQATPIEDESAAEHIANALLILRSSGELSAEDFAALDRRLTLALEQLRSAAR